MSETWRWTEIILESVEQTLNVLRETFKLKEEDIGARVKVNGWSMQTMTETLEFHLRLRDAWQKVEDSEKPVNAALVTSSMYLYHADERKKRNLEGKLISNQSRRYAPRRQDAKTPSPR